MTRAALVTVVVVCGSAHAIRAQPEDLRCATGMAYAEAPTPDRTRALIYLRGCTGQAYEAAHARIVRLAEQAGDSRVEVIAWGGLAVEIDRFPGDSVLAPSTLWLPAGTYRFVVVVAESWVLQSELILGARTSATVLFEKPKDAPAAPPVHDLDFSDEPDTAVAHVGPPPKQELGSLLPDKYRLKSNLDVPGPWCTWSRHVPVRNAVGLRIGGGVVDTGTTRATGAVSIAGVVRRAFGFTRFAAEARIDVGQRGGDTAKLWTAGAGAQLRWYPFRRYTAAEGISVTGGPRLELRMNDDVGAMAVDRFGVGAAAAIGWEPGLHRRFAVELRVEQALTVLAGTRPRAALLEVGFNL